VKRVHSLRWLATFILLCGCAAFEVVGEIQAGRIALIKGKPDQALPHFQRAAQSEPNYLTAFSPLEEGVWTYVGRAYYGIGKLEEARRALERARSRHKQDSLAKLYLGLTLIRQHKDKNQKTGKPFSLEDITYALREGIAPKRVVSLIKERGVRFELTSEGEKSLRKLGADDQLVEELKAAKGSLPEESLRERGLKEVETAMRELHHWLDDISENRSYGVFWDPGAEIRSEIRTSLTTISRREIDWQKLIASAEWVGAELEAEMDRAKQDEERELRESQPGS